MKILITGIHGFVGSNLTEALKEKYTLYGLDIITTPMDGVEKILYWKDLNDLPRVDAVIHLAGKAHDTKNKSLAQEYFEINTDLTQQIYNWFLSSDARKFLFFSSVKAAADSTNNQVLTEDVVPMPKGPYGESKREAERYIINHMSVDKCSYILRPCMIHGKGNKGNLNILYSFVAKGLPWPLGLFDNLRSFLSMDNLIYIIQLILENKIENGIYNIADDKPVSTNELIRIIASVVNRPARILNINKNFIRVLAKGGSILKLPFNTDRFEKLTENYVVSNEKIKKALDISNLRVTSLEGLTNTFKSFSA